MKKSALLIAVLILLSACSGTPTEVVVTLPTLAALASMTPTPTVTPSEPPSATPVPQVASLPTDTPAPTDTETPIPTLADTATDQPPTVSFTPSMTITDTITPTITPTFTPSPELDSLGMLALLSERATILPPEQLYNPPTLTAVALAAQTLVAGQSVTPPPAPDGAIPATYPPVNCPVPPPGGLADAFAADPSLAPLVGCPQGSLINPVTAVQAFEHGSMIYVAGSPSLIYVLTLDGRFMVYQDTWTSGEPETGGETPPLGLIEPKRGFGKVWRDHLDVRGSLGWAVTDEQGATGSVQPFDRGRAIFLPQRGLSYLLTDDPGGVSGSWREIAASF